MMTYKEVLAWLVELETEELVYDAHYDTINKVVSFHTDINYSASESVMHLLRTLEQIAYTTTVKEFLPSNDENTYVYFMDGYWIHWIFWR